MNSKNTILLYLGIFAVVVVVGAIITGSIIYKNHVVATGIESKHLSIQKSMEITNSYEVVTPLVPGSNLGIHNKIYVVHDNDRNVTCYLCDDGISCIPDRFLEEKEK